MKAKFIFFLLLTLLMGSVRTAFSCEPEIPRHPFRDSKVVFYGELVEITETNDKCLNVVKFKIDRYWKGNISEYVSLQTPTNLCCGFGFKVGEKYLVYAYPEKGIRLETSVGWVLGDDVAKERVKKLGKGRLLEPTT
jgi:hypothetical protein